MLKLTVVRIEEDTATRSEGIVLKSEQRMLKLVVVTEVTAFALSEVTI